VGTDADLEGWNGRIVVLVDRLTDAQRQTIERWVSAGGTLIVVDPRSPLVRRTVGSGGTLGSLVDPGQCSVSALAGLGAIDAPNVGFLQPESGDDSCFSSGADAFVVARSAGQGVVVELGGGSPFINDGLPRSDNAGLAVALMAPDTRPIIIVDGVPAGGGDKTLGDLIGRGLKLAFLQLVLAFVVVVAWRSRRLGAPVAEAGLVDVPSAELVAATGRLWNRAGAAEHAAAHLREGFRSELAVRLGIAREFGPHTAAAALADSSGVDAEVARVALVAEVNNEDELVNVAQAIVEVRRVSGLDTEHCQANHPSEQGVT
jgi:hypothetical protein